MSKDPDGPTYLHQDKSDGQRSTHPSLGEASRSFGIALWRAVFKSSHGVWIGLLKFLHMASAGIFRMLDAAGAELSAAIGKWRAARAQRAARTVRPAPSNAAPKVAGPVQDRPRVPRRRIRIILGLDKVIETARILGIEAKLSAMPSLASTPPRMTTIVPGAKTLVRISASPKASKPITQ